MTIVRAECVEPLMSIETTARALGVSVRFIYELMERGGLPFVQIGTRKRRITAEDFRRYVAANRVGELK